MADFEGMKRATDRNTICLVASAPEYAYGNYDPVEKIAALAQSWGIGCHSDCCLGSYVNPFIKELGYKQAYEFDFKVPGVTSISCDPHKYAYGPKGCSIALFRDTKTREYQFYVNAQWNGGLYATTCIAGSRPGSVIVGTWASMLKHGREGLKQKARGILEA
jgi:sphinganine-1-phosphate aldolase